MKILIDGLHADLLQTSGTQTVLTSTNVMNENSFANPRKVLIS